MYYDKYHPFYTVYANSAFCSGEKVQEEEFRLMKSYYPNAARRIQEIIEAECEMLDYEGSRLYDEYPDKWMLSHMCRDIYGKVVSETEAQEMPAGYLDELIQVLLYQEIFRRRCRRHRCRKYF